MTGFTSMLNKILWALAIASALLAAYFGVVELRRAASRNQYSNALRQVGLATQTSTPTIRLSQGNDALEVAGLDASALAFIRKANPTREQWAPIFSVCVDNTAGIPVG